MAGVNKVILLGNLGADPEVRHFDSGSVVANIRLATTESYKNKEGERVSNTEWHDVELWDGLAKVAEQYLKKGSQVYIEGKIKTDSWQDENDQTRRRTKIRGTGLTMLGDGGSSPSETPSAPKPPSSTPSGSDIAPTDELPF